MEVRRAADFLLRSSSSNMTTFLTPLNTVRWTKNCQLRTSRPSKATTRRTFVTSHKNQAIRPVTTTAAPSQPPKSPVDSSNPPPNDSVSSLSSDLWANKPSRKSLFGDPKPTNSAHDLLFALNKSATASPTKSDLPSSFTRMMSPTRSREERELGDAIDMAGINGDLAGEFAAPSVARPKLRLNPTTGRTVLIGGTTDLAYGFKMLDIGVNQNRVKRDFQQQRFHERGGLKRKRLGRERWRKRFGEGFKAVVGRVKYLRKQGW